MKKVIIKICVLMLIIGLNWAGFSAIGETMAYFSDTENSLANSMQAAMLDFSITNRHIESFIGMESLSEIKFASVVTKKIGSLNIQYEVNAEAIDGNNEDFCNALIMEAEHNGIEKHDGPLLSFSAPSTTQLGTWEFEIDLPASATNVPHGAECNVDLVFKGWRTDIVTFEESGFTDEERIELRLTSRMIVLNEFLPRPDGWAYGFDFGNDSSDMPQGEWVELYNNSDYSFDLAGWYIKDSLESDTNKIIITGSNTVPAGTTINPKSWLVVYMNKAVLDNTGDTVKLFDDSDNLIDSYTYTSHDYCELEPTPGDENSDTTGGGSCGLVPPNKSYARIPDGIGYWVDPIPTPGGPNTLVFEQNNFENQNNSENTVDDISTEETLIEETPAITQEDTNTADDELFTVEEPQEPISNPLDVGVIETTTPPDDGIAFEEETIVEEEPVAEEPTEEEVTPVPSIEDGATGQVTEEETSSMDEQIPTETSGETTEDVIEETSSETDDSTISEENAEESATEENSDEVPVVEEQPATLPDESASNPDGAGENNSDGESGDAGVDTSGSLDDSSPTEGAGENSADGGEDSGSNGDTETGLGNSDE